MNSLEITNVGSPIASADAELIVGGGAAVDFVVTNTFRMWSNNQVTGGDDVRFYLRESGTEMFVGNFVFLRENSANLTEMLFRMHEDTYFEVTNDFELYHLDNVASETYVEFRLADDNVGSPTDEAPMLLVNGNFTALMNRTGGSGNINMHIRELSTLEVMGDMTLRIEDAPANPNIWLFLADLTSRTVPGADNLTYTFCELIVHGTLRYEIPFLTPSGDADHPDIRADIRGNASVTVGNLEMYHLNGNGELSSNNLQDNDLIFYENASLTILGDLRFVSDIDNLSINNLLELNNDSRCLIEGDIIMRAGSDDMENKIYCTDNSLLELKGVLDRDTDGPGLASSYLTEGRLEFDTNSTLKISGDDPMVTQTIPWPHCFKIVNLIIDNTSGNEVLLEGSLRIEGTLTMLNGIVSTSEFRNVSLWTCGSYDAQPPHQIRFASSFGGYTDAVSNLGSSASFIRGMVRVDDRNGGASTINLPLGTVFDGVPYSAPVTLEFFNSTNIAAFFEYKRGEAIPNNTNLSGSIDKVSELEYWEVGRSSGGAWASGEDFSGTVTLHWSDACASGIEDVTLMLGAYLDNNNTLFTTLDDVWIDPAVVRFGEQCDINDLDSETGYVSFSVPDIANRTRALIFASTNEADNPLPVEACCFTLSRSVDGVMLTWDTYYEFEADSFIIYRSEDGVSFDRIAGLKANGDSRSQLSYSYVDRALSYSTVYYQLTELDIYGNEHFIDLKSIKVGDIPTEKILLYPNPVQNNQLTVLAPAINEEVQWDIYNANGVSVREAVSSFTVSQGKIHIEFNLLPGVYFLKMYHADGVHLEKFMNYSR
ncbi:T9SS type A sorting domain-containing protein [Cytophagales bacterium LB-30]|uniref:T9SS type A sorting domain-containing protein n=1 Tax=Shiella aurantiaca TaxID=3058365 RepID=A0ABT8F4A9_9BACT|nr:T9SS type A sorting domain-containing protein [Shiella aurantiaca]MDN4165104.1 T9SS type A sorting domain-containing protein [Shiella aurantiaca]